ncbi:ABC transporter permease [Azospirillum baldaniorum]|uniref:ABC transporter type 1 GsiC-like N-terminal domain-containing protein n=1 Tax=Azospirillum baldaniorum TaxID=1064539 RepID=A0A9P1JP09_9PROT|nr:ABC transporter permease [Azospirillum baldaniorum]CCC97060.1 exported protein of unknown function [Azospirillum baldaniorum]
MTRFLASRLLQALVVLLLMSFVITVLMTLMPGDPVDMMLAGNPRATPADAARLKALYGLDKPLLDRYWHWLQAALMGDFGFSRLYAQPVLTILLPRLGNTLLLLGAAMALTLAVTLPLGVYAARRPYGWADNAINLFCFARYLRPGLLAGAAADPALRGGAAMAAGFRPRPGGRGGLVGAAALPRAAGGLR